MYKNDKVNRVSDTIDYRMRAYLEEVEGGFPYGTSQVTLRIPNELKGRLDVIASFLEMNRTSLIVALLDAAVEDAIERIENHPYIKIKDKSLRQMIEDEDSGLMNSVNADLR